MFSAKKQSDLFINKLFANADKKKVKFKFSSDKLITFKEGDIVFKKGDKSKYIYLIMEGEVKLKIPNPPFAPKIQFKYMNDFFGEKELLERKERVSSCVAEKACQLYPITETDLQKLISSSNTVKDNLEMVTISNEGKTLKEITKESTGEKEEEKIDYDKAIKIHPEKPITGAFKDTTNEKEITLEDLFVTDKVETDKKIIKNEIEKTKEEDIPEVEIHLDDTKEKELKEESQPKKDADESHKKGISEENKTVEKIKTTGETTKVTEEISPEVTNEIIEPEEEKISEDKYFQIIEAGHSLLKLTEEDQLIDEIVKQAKELVTAERGLFFFINEEEKMLEAKVKDDKETTDLKIPLNKSISGICALRNKIAIIDDVTADDRFNPIYDEVFNFKTKNMLILPISDEDENVIVVLELLNSKEEKFTELDIEILKLFSKSILLGLANCKNIKNIIAKTNENAFTGVSKYIYGDIKNPLITIKNYIKILIKDKIPEEIKQVLKLIIKQADFVDSVNDNLTSFDEDNTNLQLKVFPLKDTIDDILGLLAEYSESRNVVLFKKIDVEAKVKLDPKNFMVACYQIIKNACDVQPEKGSVYITSALNNETINIEFKDFGDGVSTELQEKIFDNFTTFKNEDHFGIGLNIADKIIKGHGGELKVSNSSEGGAVFTISLPAVKE